MQTWTRDQQYLGSDRRGYYMFRREIAENVTAWILKNERGTYYIEKSTHLGNYKFETVMLKDGFKNAKTAREWVDANC